MRALSAVLTHFQAEWRTAIVEIGEVHIGMKSMGAAQQTMLS
jgi:hypothetical protein